MVRIAAAAVVALASGYPVPNARQLDFMEIETMQFMHFGIDTAWNPPEVSAGVVHWYKVCANTVLI